MGGELKGWRIEGSLFGLTSQPPSGSELVKPLGPRLVRRPERAGILLAVHGGSEDYEPKLSLVPLVFGTLKGTFYALLLAAPLALGGAAYVSHFTSPELRAWIKPAIEMMACRALGGAGVPGRPVAGAGHQGLAAGAFSRAWLPCRWCS